MSARNKARKVEPQLDVSEEWSAEQINKVLIQARKEVGLSVIQEYVIRQLSNKLEAKLKHDLANEMSRSEWYIYNVRRDAVRKLAKMLGVLDEEELFHALGLRRGHKMPPRQSRYWGRAEQAPEVQAMASYLEEVARDPDEENIDDGGAAAAEEYAEFGNPDNEDPFEDEESEDEESDDDDDEEDDESEG